MTTDFGFMPVLTGKRYFISYKSDGSDRIGEITRRLNEMGVPMWYDYGIKKGELWEKEVNRNIEECEAFILFATKTLFSSEDTWVRKEFRLANMYEKKIHVVWLDSINLFVNPDDVIDELSQWYVEVREQQGSEMAGKTVEQIAWQITEEFHLTKRMNSQSPLPALKVNVRKGNKYQFGQYPQGANGDVQPIEWRVLAVENGMALLITDKLIDYVKYFPAIANITWRTCTLRNWMNNDFLDEAFSLSEQEKIMTVTNPNPNNPKYGTIGCKPTQDKIFALSINEAEAYFRNDDDRKAYTTDYAHSQGYDYKDRSEYWWLRSPGDGRDYAASVDDNGSINQSGSVVDCISVAVRPACWLNLQ